MWQRRALDPASWRPNGFGELQVRSQDLKISATPLSNGKVVLTVTTRPEFLEVDADEYLNAADRHPSSPKVLVNGWNLEAGQSQRT